MRTRTSKRTQDQRTRAVTLSRTRAVTFSRPRAVTLSRVAGSLAVAVLLAACSGGGQGAGKPPPGVRGGGNGVFVVGPQGAVPLREPFGGGRGTRPQISVGRIPPANTGETIELPLDSYQQVASQQQAALAAVRLLLIQRCMQAKGFSYPASPQPANAGNLLLNIEAPADGITSLAQAETYGYAQPRSQTGGNGRSGNGPRGGSGAQPSVVCGGMGCFSAPNLRTHSKAWLAALFGFFPGARATKRPQPGCVQTTAMQLSGRHYFVGDPLPGLAEQAAVWTQSDPRILAVQRSWSACMAARGYRFQLVLQPERQRWPTAPTRAEIATAVADVSCKNRVNLPNTWLAVEAAYQRAIIVANLTVLTQWQTTFSAAVRRAETLLGAG